MDYLKSLGLTKVNSGAWSGSTSLASMKETRLVSVNPATEEDIAQVLTADAHCYEEIMVRAQAAAKLWREVPAPQRGSLVYQIAQRLRQCKESLGHLISLEMGKSLVEAQGEVQEMIDMADLAIGQSRMLYGKTMHSERANHRMYEQWHPYGVIGIISAFNFPVAVWSWNAFLAIICGNAVVWKPSSKTPLSAIAVQHICSEALKEGKYPDLFSLFIPASHDVAELMLEDVRLPLISFTGSTQVGRRISERVASRLGKSLLELGGNNAVIVDETADLNLVIPAIVFGAIGTAGQRCTTTRRVFIHEKCYDDVLNRLVTAYASLKIGSPLDTTQHMGPLVDEQAVIQFEKAVSMLRKKGSKIVYGGERLKRTGYFVQPTLVAEVKNEWDLLQTETFAPILYVMRYAKLEEAIAMQNAVPQGLSSALFTQNLSHAELFLSAMGSDCGIANINVGTSGAEIGGAFGGEKETGGGREAGSDAWKMYMRRQTNTINWGNSLPLAQGIKFEL
jgi:aldehyde dehydrogenase (NAD+)